MDLHVNDEAVDYHKSFTHSNTISPLHSDNPELYIHINLK